MAHVDFSKPSGLAPRYDQIPEALKVPKDCSGAFADAQRVKRALSALQRGPIRFRRNNVIACEGDAADYIFIVVSGVVRSCKTFQNGTRGVVAFYLPGDLFGWSDQNYTLSVEAATNATVLFLKRSALVAVASRESRVANSLLDLATIELRRAQEHGLLMSRSAKCRVATFLTELSKRLGKTGSIHLSMSHQDIADHLGLTIETLSRTITELERSGLIARMPPRSLMVRKQYSLSHLVD
jgi:CRP/FNR family nitrogen fixation transcriptional regulator